MGIRSPSVCFTTDFCLFLASKAGGVPQELGGQKGGTRSKEISDSREREREREGGTHGWHLGGIDIMGQAGRHVIRMGCGNGGIRHEEYSFGLVEESRVDNVLVVKPRPIL